MTAPSGTRAAAALRRALPALTLLLLAVSVYLPSLPGTFIVDDWPIVAENPLVTGHDVRGILTSDYWGPGRRITVYRPLTLLSFALDHALFGPDPLPYHLVNVALHAAAALLVAALAAGIGLPPAGAWFAGALFAVHPIHLEAVNLIVGRAELLGAVFGLLFLLAARSPSAAARRGSPVLLLGALLAKESAVVLPAALVACDLFTGTSPRAVARERGRLYLTVAVVTLAWLAARLWLRGFDSAGIPPVDPHDNPLTALATLPRILTALRIQLMYLARLLVPVGLQGVYDASSVQPVGSILSPRGAALALSAAIAAGLIVDGFRRRRGAALGALLYLVGFGLTANLFFVHWVMLAERLAYFPSAGYAVAVAAFFSGAAGGGTGWRRTRRALGLAYLAILAAVTVAQGPDWARPERLWERTIARNPANARAWTYLGDVRGRAGDLVAAERAYRQAVAAAPSFRLPWEQLGYVLLLQGRPAEALDVYRQALRSVGVEPPGMRVGMAVALLELGEPAAALEQLSRTLPADAPPGVWHDLERRARAMLAASGDLGRHPGR